MAALERLSSLASAVGDVGFLAVVQRLQDGAAADTEPATLSTGWKRIVDAAVVG